MNIKQFPAATILLLSWHGDAEDEEEEREEARQPGMWKISQYPPTLQREPILNRTASHFSINIFITKRLTPTRGARPTANVRHPPLSLSLGVFPRRAGSRAYAPRNRLREQLSAPRLESERNPDSDGSPGRETRRRSEYEIPSLPGPVERWEPRAAVLANIRPGKPGANTTCVVTTGDEPEGQETPPETQEKIQKLEKREEGASRLQNEQPRRARPLEQAVQVQTVQLERWSKSKSYHERAGQEKRRAKP